MYTLLSHFIQLYLKMTKLYCYNQDNSHFSVFERYAELSRVHWNSPDLNPLDYHVRAIMSGVLCWKGIINSSQSL